MQVDTLQEAIAAQAAIIRFLSRNGIKDLVGDYGELLIHRAFGGERKSAVHQGYDILHPEFGRIEVKTRKYELKEDGSIRKESRAVGFKGKENGFDWLAHVVLDTDFSLVGACLAPYAQVWLEIERTTGKVGFPTSSKLPGSRLITSEVKAAQLELGFGI